MDAEEYRAFTSRGEFIFGQSEVHAFMRAAARKFRGDRGYFGSSRLLPGAFLYKKTRG